MSILISTSPTVHSTSGIRNPMYTDRTSANSITGTSGFYPCIQLILVPVYNSLFTSIRFLFTFPLLIMLVLILHLLFLVELLRC